MRGRVAQLMALHPENSIQSIQPFGQILFYWAVNQAIVQRTLGA
ncbi:hypothetical protein ABR330_14775 [Bacillus cabrialesii subsp. cabrialesii]